MSNGAVQLFDRSTASLIHSFDKHHQFEVWFTLFDGEDKLYTSSDDSTFKLVDIRQPNEANIVYTNKKHGAGVTFLAKLSETTILSGSHDNTVRVWDERNMKCEVQEINIGDCSVWDLKFNSNNSDLSFGISAIYEGYFFAKQEQKEKLRQGLLNLDNYQLLQYKGHESICYAFEFVPSNDNLILTSSFYDSKLHLIEYKEDDKSSSN